MSLMLSRRSFLSSATATLASTRLRAVGPLVQASASRLVYIGSTTRSAGDGIHVAQWNASTGTLSDLRLAFEAVSPSFLALSRKPGPRLLFAGHQVQPRVGGLTSFRIEPYGNLTPINTVNAPGADFVHILLDRTERCLIAANYGAGTILTAKVAPDGTLSGFVSNIQLTGHGPIASRQTAPHAHGVALSPNNRFVYINDLGTDRILIYRLNPSTAELTPSEPAFFPMPAGSGPRHLAFHPNGRWAYSVNELDSTLTLFTWNPTTGALTSVAAVPTMVAGADVSTNRAGEIAFDAAGRFLYSCNRGGAEELLTYAVGPDGRLTFLARVPTGDKEARHFIVTPDDGYLLVARQFGNDVAVFSRDRRSGLLKPTGARYPANNASCVLFA
jgi:6-phosphogluconolactonase